MKNTKFLVILLLVVTILVNGCSSSLSGRIDITNKKLESGETTNMYITVTYSKATFGGKPHNVTVDFVSGEGLEVLKDNQIITSDVIENLDGSTTRIYTLRARNIRAQQITDSVTVRMHSDDGTTFSTISDLVAVTPRRA